MSTENETNQLTSSPLTQNEYVGSAHAHKHFPKGQRIKRSITSFRRSGSSLRNSTSSLVLMKERLPLYSERTMHLYLPRLTFDNSTNRTETLLSAKRTKCSYVANNKFHLKKKGINLSDLYSLKHNKRGNFDYKIHRDDFSAPMNKSSDVMSPIPVNINNRTIPAPWNITCTLRSNGSRQTDTESPMYIRLMRGLEREAKIPGHVRPEDCTGKRLGKVLTKDYLENLLKQEKPVIPAAFYMKS